MSGEFADTNILVYAHDTSAGKKRDLSMALVQRLTDERSGLLSVQVLMEFYVTVTRKIFKPFGPHTAAEIVKDLSTWKVFSPDADDVIEAIRISQANRISLWDGMIIRAAAVMGAEVIWSEDLTSHRDYEGVTVKNPFSL